MMSHMVGTELNVNTGVGLLCRYSHDTSIQDDNIKLVQCHD